MLVRVTSRRGTLYARTALVSRSSRPSFGLIDYCDGMEEEHLDLEAVQNENPRERRARAAISNLFRALILYKF